MRVSIATAVGDLRTVDIDPSIEIENFKALVDAEVGIPANLQRLVHHGVELNDPKKSLSDYKVVQDDVILVLPTPGSENASSGSPSSAKPSEAQAFDRIKQLMNDPHFVSQLQATNPELAALAKSNPGEFMKIIQTNMNKSREEEMARMAAMQHLDQADPFDVEAQLKIEKMIRMQNIERNRATALEFHPESFVRVTMLYINCEVNGYSVKAFVDSGAQATIMSPDCAQACNITHLIDDRYAGIAQGVGTAKILGRVHSAQIKVGNQFLPCAFTIMEGKSVDLLFGLDMLKRHQACIDLKRNVLIINEEDVHFLPENELPDKAIIPVAPEDNAPVSSSSSKPTDKQSSTTVSNSSKPITSTPNTLAGKLNNTLNAGSNPQQHSEEKIRALVDLGVSRDEAIAALNASGGNPDIAASLLF